MTLPTPAAAGAFLLKNWLPALLAVALIVQTVRIEGVLWFDGFKENLEDCEKDKAKAEAELKSISDTKNTQGEVTKGNVAKADKGDKQAREIADKIREAPIPLNCETPGLEILRNEI